MGQQISSSSVDWNYIAPPIIEEEQQEQDTQENTPSNSQTNTIDNEKIETLNTLLKLLEHSINNSFYNKNFRNKNEVIIEQLETTIKEIEEKKKLNESKFFTTKEKFTSSLNENKNIEKMNYNLKIGCLVVILVALFVRFAI